MISVDLITDIYSPSGYSAHAREVIRAIHDKVDLRIVDHKHDRMTVELESMEAALFKSLEQKDRPAQVRVQFETPEFFEPAPGVVNIGFTQWETTRIPTTDHKGNERNNWLKQMNRMDRMWTSSQAAADAFRNSGVTVPTDVLYGPVDVNLHCPGLPELDIDDLVYDSHGSFVPREKRPLVLGMVAQWTLRKNIEDFLITVLSRFKRGEVHILLKTYGNVMNETQAKVVEQRVKQTMSWVENPEAPRISMITEKLTDTQIAQLFASIDVYVSTSRGEGFCLPVTQAMATGCIPVVCGFGAPGEYVKDRVNGYVLPYQLRSAVGMPGWYRYDQLWADVDCTALEDAIRHVMFLRSTHQEALKEMSTAARQTIVDSMSHQAAGRKYLECIERAVTLVPAA